MANKFAGQIKGRTIEARFAFSGKLVALRKNIGDSVSKGEVLASLDRKLLQLESQLPVTTVLSGRPL